MGLMVPSRSGLAYGGSDKFEIFLRQFSGEVLAAFAERNVMMPLHTVRTIDSGKSASFPMTGTTTAAYQVPGTELLGTSIAHAERVISIDNLLVASAFVANIDEAINHFDVRSIYSKEIGYALSNVADKACIRSVIAGSLDDVDAIGNTGLIKSLTTSSTGDGMINALLVASQTFDERDIPQEGRSALITPQMFYNVLRAAGDSDSQGSAILNRDFGGTASPTQGGMQSLTVGGIKVYMSNHIPTADESTATSFPPLGDGVDGARNDPFVEAGASGASATEGYSGINFTGYQGIVFHTSGVGTVKLLDLAVESDYLVQNQGTLLVGKYAMGHNYLRAEACIGLKAS